jgi:hypothetical protein
MMRNEYDLRSAVTFLLVGLGIGAVLAVVLGSPTEGSAHLSLDFGEAEQELATVPRSESPEDCFDKEWVRSLFVLGLQRLRASCESGGKIIHFELFERYDLEDADPKPSYAQLANGFGLAATDVTNYLAFARREFRRCVLDQLREMTASEEEFRREAKALLGWEVR